MWDVVGVGANSIDFVYRLPVYPQPDSATAKLRITSAVVSPGGQTTTALCTCAAMGLRARYVGAFGSDEHGRSLRDELIRRHIDVGHTVTREVRNAYAVILVADRHGERVVLWDRDPRLTLQAADIDPDVIRDARLLHVDDVDPDAALRAAGIARAAGIPIVCDIEAATDRTEDLTATVTMPIFAEHVPCAMTGEPDLEPALRRLRRPGHRLLCVTRGSRGAILLDGDRLHQLPGFAIDVVDTTGAGDVFRGALIYALLRGDNPADILRFANAAAAVSCTRRGAITSVPTVDETMRLLAAAKSTKTD
jgi:sugar/nucleoside kinase (ribokinase family)